MILQKTMPLINSRANVEQRASFYLASFMEDLFNIANPSVVKAFNECIHNLDSLAIKIDDIIDNKDYPNASKFSVDSFENLDNEIMNCLNSITNTSPKLVSKQEIMIAVNKSFTYNTEKRSEIYSLDNLEMIGCTAYYLMPLASKMALFGRHPYSENFFLLYANCIQLIDDCIDVFEDIEKNIQTPVTQEFHKLALEFSQDFSGIAFNMLTKKVLNRLDDFLNEMEIEAIKNKYNNFELYLYQWREFHAMSSLILLPNSDNLTEQKRYLETIHGIVPPMLNYTDDKA